MGFGVVPRGALYAGNFIDHQALTGRRDTVSLECSMNLPSSRYSSWRIYLERLGQLQPLVGNGP